MRLIAALTDSASFLPYILPSNQVSPARFTAPAFKREISALPGIRKPAQGISWTGFVFGEIFHDRGKFNFHPNSYMIV